MKKKKIISIFVVLLLLLIVGGVVIVGFIGANSLKRSFKIIGDKSIVIKYGEEYQEKGASIRLFNKDMSKDIKVISNVDSSKVGNYKVTYKYSFLFINEEKTRDVTVVDEDFPSIELLGNEKIVLYVGETYNEPGYKAIDNYDGDITDKVEVVGNVDTSKQGEYEIVYSVKDSNDNEVKVSRNVTISVRNVSGLPVLMYHFFYDPDQGEKSKDGNWINIHAFEEQVKYLVDNGYYFPSWQEVVDYVNGTKSLPEKSVVITADDGNPSFFTLAVPVARKYNVKITGFIVGSWTGKEYLVGFPDINFESHTYAMHQGGCSTGHGGLMQCISYDKGVEDIKKSTDNVGSSYAIAYPFGDVNDNVVNITRDAGVKLGFTTEYGKVKPGMDPYRLPRVRVSEGQSLSSFVSRL